MRLSLVSFGLSFSISSILVGDMFASQGYVRLDKEIIMSAGIMTLALWLGFYLSFKKVFHF
ncbi:hypothetical protein [Stygiolobus caldivivus]|uniref:Uncharacterized protein n=1 Tax=Stygiolobus caldivivus TaxID=2824673 RepID=A0A8D5U469_9CREN|nr:hypothetical protein [Stygiolobus caldivivus]BCU69086.1 hypothetical protein KN1_03830 [Stygiolobus caldivivus]